MAANLDNFEIPDRTVTRALRAPTQRRTVGIGPLLDWFATYLSCFGEQPVATLDARKGGVRRDLRIDFLRGVALLVIFTDHVRFNLLSQYTPKNFGFSDMAEVFVFLSGYVCALSYGRVLESSGMIRCYRKAIGRSLQLFVAAWITDQVVARIVRMGQAVTMTGIWGLILGPTTAEPLVSSGRVTDWTWLPSSDDPGWILSILGLYVVLLLLLPFMLWLGRKHLGLMLGLSLVFYVWAQVDPVPWRLSSEVNRLLLFDPMAWQFLFFLGVAWSEAKARCVHWEDSMTLIGGFWGWLLTVISMLTIFFAVDARLVWWPEESIRFTGKVHLEPLRLFHFLSLVWYAQILMFHLPNKASPFWHRTAFRPLILCGQNSLIVFCVGAILAALASMVTQQIGEHLAWHVVLNVAGWCVCGGAAMLLSRAKRWRLNQL